MPKPLIYTHSKVVKLTELQYQTLKKLEKYNVSHIEEPIYLGELEIY